MCKKKVFLLGIGMVLLLSACGKDAKESGNEATGSVDTKMEQETESLVETTVEFETAQTTDLEIEVSETEESDMENVEADGSELRNITADELEKIIATEVASLEISSKHQYELCDTKEREALYQGFLEGTIKAKATENQRLDDYYFAELYANFNDGTLDDYIADFTKEVGDVYQIYSFRLPFDDGNEMLCVELQAEAAMGGHMVLTFQATTEGLILVSTDYEEYVSGLYSFHPNGLLEVADRGNAVCHYERFYLLTENCEKFSIGSWMDVDACTYYSEITGDYPADQDIYEYVQISQANILGITFSDIYRYIYSDEVKTYEDSEGMMEQFASDTGLMDGYIVQDHDLAGFSSVPELFMKYRGLKYDSSEYLTWDEDNLLVR